jgi:hypothetical protein
VGEAGLQLIDHRRQRLLLLGRAPQLEQHVRHWQIVGYRTAVVGGLCLGTRVAGERHQSRLVDLLGEQPRRGRRRLRLRLTHSAECERQHDEYRKKEVSHLVPPVAIVA